MWYRIKYQINCNKIKIALTWAHPWLCQLRHSLYLPWLHLWRGDVASWQDVVRDIMRKIEERNVWCWQESYWIHEAADNKKIERKIIKISRDNSVIIINKIDHIRLKKCGATKQKILNLFLSGKKSNWHFIIMKMQFIMASIDLHYHYWNNCFLFYYYNDCYYFISVIIVDMMIIRVESTIINVIVIAIFWWCLRVPIGTKKFQ